MSDFRKKNLRDYFSKTTGNLDPILTSLNGDNSWLISFPIPPNQRNGKAYYHIVSDAWLQGYAITISSWLVYIGLASPPAVTNGSEVDALVQEIEDVAAEAGILGKGASNPPRTVDAIFANFHYPDHLSEDTLRTFSPDIPVFATKESEVILKSWNHFNTTITQKDINVDDPNWRSLHPGAPLPEWLSVFRLVGHHELNFATAMVWSSNNDSHEALVYSPHGISTDQPSLQTFAHKLSPAIKVKAIMHALKDSFAFGIRTTLGVAGGLALEEETRPKYWIRSHDSLLDYRGVIMRLFVRDYTRTIESGIQEMLGKKTEADKVKEERKPNLVTVDNGGCFVLE
ncbi:hypothetical protein DM02DRAFT_588383 [Periconia macrospinosa]|uniref:Uncharacterized protein n=1 Tax=Periconia macrospinosa TaxID=97972 RepID=A0A2V1E0U0_9PLEO|nr:hypothetical protein DM02DRAFT_588383 [Periconia macrospinosa]